MRNKDLRDWATFGLGVQGSSDSFAIRDALLERLSDADQDVREEAMVGLGKRKNPVSRAARPRSSMKLRRAGVHETESLQLERRTHLRRSERKVTSHLAGEKHGP